LSGLGIQGALFLGMKPMNLPTTMDDDLDDYDAYTAACVAGQEAYFRSLPVPQAPEVSDDVLAAWERRNDPTW
jgi:hypothetical protein